MKFREVFRYELSYRLHSASTWVYAAILCGLGFLMMNGGGSPGAEAIQHNAPVQMAFLTVLLGLFGLAVSAGIFGDAAVRDVRAGMDPLVFTLPVRRRDYLGGRFAAALAVNAFVLLAIPLGLALPVVLGLPDTALYGPFRPGAYLEPWLYLLLPNMVFAGAVLFALGALTRQTIPVYLGAIGILFVSLFMIGVGGENTGTWWSVLAPTGVHAVTELTEYWTTAERNARLVGLPLHLALNRAVWLGVSVVVLAALHLRFRFAHPDGGRVRRRGRRRVIVDTASQRFGPVAVPRATRTFRTRTAVRQTLAIARQSLSEIAASRWFVVVLVACIALTLLWGWNAGDTAFDTSIWPVTMLVSDTVLSQRVTLLVYALITLYAGELVWREREAGTAEIAEAAPVPETAALLGRFLALVALLAMVQAACMAGGILIQAFQGYHNFEIGLYLRVVFGLDLATYVLLAALAMTVHIVVNQKYLGHMVALLLMIGPRFSASIGIRHHLLRYGTDPGWTYSDMNGFGPFVGPFIWFKLYWAAWALLLMAAAILLRERTGEAGLRDRIREARMRFAGPAARMAGVAVPLILILGGFIFYNTNVLNEYGVPEDAGAPQAEYEKRHGRFADSAQPTIMDAELRVEVWPDEPAVDVRGTYLLVNRTGVPIDSVHVMFIDPDVEARSITFDRASEPVLVDEDLDYRIYALHRALEPGDSVTLAFDVSFRRRGFRNTVVPADVVGNGTSFNRSWLPFIGYQPMRELTDPEARRRYGLAPVEPAPEPDALKYRQPFRDADLVHVDAVIGTAADQTAVTSGVLRSTWTENGRRYFHYETEGPTLFGANVFSARYAVVEDRWNDVALRIFHHPGHTYDLDRTTQGMKAALSYFTAQFGPYPGKQLSVVEIPRYGGFGTAHPEAISFTEDYFLARVKEGEVDQPFYGTAHEVAHQWWGGKVRGARLPGAGFLSESLANYSAMMVVENTFGRDAAWRVYDFQMERYLRGRATQSREVPLIEVEDQPYIAYRKGAIALYTLRDRIGADAVNTALHRYFERFADAGPPYPTSRDLLDELRLVTPDSAQSLLTDWFETVTLWDLRTQRALVEPTATGEFAVTLDIVARKLRADRVGNETEVPMDEPVDIGVFESGGDDRFGRPIRIERHRIRSGTQTIRITVPRAPVWAGIDSRHRLIDRQPDNNVIEVRAAPPELAGGGL